nr:reverse transcriptase domain-containing protein [Tanacetum cinerariifolium]
MFPITQIDTFYNGLTLRHRDTINVAAGGTFMKRRPEECYDLIENMTAHHNDWDTSAQWRNNQGRNQFLQGASHGPNPPPAYQAPSYQALSYQAPVHQPSIPQPQVVTTTEFTNYMKANDAILKNMQTNVTSLTNSNLELKNMFGQFMKMNTASSSDSRTLLSNTITSPKGDLKVERETEVTQDMVPPTNNKSTKDCMSTRSSARNLFPPLDNPELTIRRRSHVDHTLLNDFEMATDGNGDPPVPDLWTMEELCLPTLNGQGGPIAPIGGTFMKMRPEGCYDLIEYMTAHHNDWDTSAQRSESSSSITSSSDLEIVALKAEMVEINKNLTKVLQINQQVKAVAHNCETCGGPHSYNTMIVQPPLAKPRTYMLLEPIKVTNMTSLTNSNHELKNMFGQFMKMNTASTSSSRTLPSNTITNSKEDLKGITTRSGTTYKGPTIPTTSSSLPQVVECETEVTKDTVSLEKSNKNVIGQ